tara:strand:+ start:310 stop:843 length:534 start_codon:yes stop_codon:yes gene_type:complete
MLRMPVGEVKGERRMRVSEILTDSMLQILDDTALKFFGRTPRDAVEKGECVGCDRKVDLTMHPHRLERYRICGMCSECQHDWMPNLFDEEVGTVIAPEDRVTARRDVRFRRSRRKIIDYWDVMEPITIKELQKRTELNPSTIMKQMKDMMKNNEVNEILVNGRQTFMLMKEVKDDLY